MNKRDFIKLGLGTIFTNTAFAYSNASKEIPNLIFIMYRGGSDGLSLLVPNDPYYLEYRKEIAIEQKNVLSINHNYWGINNKLKNSYHDFYKQDEAIFIPFAGEKTLSRSHFQAQDMLEYGANGKTLYSSGLLARLNHVLNYKNKTKSISFTENLSTIFLSDKEKIANLDVKHMFSRINIPKKSEKYNEELSEVYDKVLENTNFIQELTSKKDVDTSSKLSNIANFMKIGNYKIGFTDYGDWDMHVHQKVRMNNLLENLDKELKSLKETMGDEWSNTIVITVSEFGRVLKTNGGGTDHGHGSLMGIFGGLVSKSKIIGEPISLHQDKLFQNRDLPVDFYTNDILAECFSSLYGLNKKEIEYILPGCNPSNFNIIG